MTEDANTLSPGKAYAPVCQGGEGSGNFGHSGRQGERGGSGEGGGGADKGKGKKEASPGKDKNGKYLDNDAGRDAFMRDEFKRREDAIDAAKRAEAKKDALAALVPDPANSMSVEERDVYWGKDRNASSHLISELDAANIRGLKVNELHGTLGTLKAQLVEGGKVKMNFDMKLPFHYKSARREDIPALVDKVRKEADGIWKVITPREKQP